MDTPTVSTLGERQRALLTLLLETKEGMSAEQLADNLEISRTAVHQHVTVLENHGYLDKHMRPSSGGRPGFVFRLTDKGVHLFPKQYALFSRLMLETIKKSMGSEGLVRVLEDLGTDLAGDFKARLRGKSPEEQVRAVAAIMLELGYQARATNDPEGRLPMIDARNCVFHHLASEHEEVCRLDLALLKGLLDADVEHVECMVRGGEACKFRFVAPKRRSNPRVRRST